MDEFGTLSAWMNQRSESARSAGKSSHSTSSLPPLAGSTAGRHHARHVMPLATLDFTPRNRASVSRVGNRCRVRLSSDARSVVSRKRSMNSHWRARLLRPRMISTSLHANGAHPSGRWNGTGPTRAERLRISVASIWKSSTGLLFSNIMTCWKLSMELVQFVARRKTASFDSPWIMTMRMGRSEDFSAIVAIEPLDSLAMICPSCVGLSRISCAHGAFI